LSSISRQRGKVQTPAWIRSTLVATGSPQQEHTGFPVSQHIGPRPDLKKAIDKLERPSLVAPAGTISDSTPTFKWNKVPGASQYRFEVYRGNTLVYTKTAFASSCAGEICTSTPTNRLQNAAHKWRAQAYIGSSWKTFSAYKDFTVSDPALGFDSSFNGSAVGWSNVKGFWNIDGGMYYRSTGLANKWASTKHTTTYGNFTYEARLKRDGSCSGCANTLVIRGNPNNFTTWYDWKPSYEFSYNNIGYFAVWEITNTGAEIPLKNWTSSAAIIKYGWNTLKVIADGTSLKFLINGKLVWYGSDPTLKSGTAGLMFYRYSTYPGTLLVDWAKLTAIFPDQLSTALHEEVLPGVEIPGGSNRMSPEIAP